MGKANHEYPIASHKAKEGTLKIKELIEKLSKLDPEFSIYICLDNEDPNSMEDIVSIGCCSDGPNTYYGLCMESKQND